MKMVKKSLLILMAVMMILTAWVFVAPEKAEAIGITSQTAGGYYLKVTHTAPGDVSSTSKGGWGKTPNDAYIVSSRTYSDNGRSSSASYGWNYWTGTGSKTYVEPRSGDNDGSPLTSPVGFPDGVYASLNDNKVAGSTTAKVTKIEIGSSTSNYTTVWTGTGYMSSTNNPYYVYIYASDNKTGSSDGGNSSDYGYVSTTSKNWTMPYPICTYQGDEYVYVSQNGTTQKTYGISTAKDQYGVNWGFSSVTWESSNTNLVTINNSGVATFGWNNGMEYDIILTPTLVHSSGNKKPTGKTVHVRPLKELSLNTEENVNISVSNGQRWYKFTPSSSGDYVFFSYGTSVDSQIYVYDSSFNQLAYDDDYGHEGTAPASATNTGGKGGDIRVLLGNGTTSSTTQSYVVGSTESYTVVNLTANSTYYVKARCYGSGTGTYPMKVCKAVDITFNGAGGKKSSNNSVTYIMPAGHTMHLDKTDFTRSDHNLLGWCSTEYDYMRQEPREYTAAQTITVPNSDTTYVALWNPTDPSTVSVNTDYTASVPNAYQITYYKFTPTETRDYIYYSKASASDPYGVLYNASDWANSGSILAYDDDSGNSNSSFTGSSSAGNFFIRKELTKNTNYLLGVKRFNIGTGDVPFRIEPVYKVEYDANSGTNAPDNQDKFVNKNLTLSSTQPTRTGYTFLGWSTSSTATTASYSAGGSYTANADAKLYAVWKPNTYTVAYNGNGSTGGSTASSSHTYDVAKDLTANGFTRAYTVTYNAVGGTASKANDTVTATFNGWATSADNSVAYTNSQSVKNLTATNGAIVNLYAKWTLGSVNLPTATKDFDENYHYSFNGWYTASSGGTKTGNAGASYTPTATTTLYAQYTETPHNYDYAAATFNWTGFACSNATVACPLDGGHNTNVSTTVTSEVTTEPTYGAAGERTYTAKFTKNSTEYTDSKIEPIPKLETLINLDDVALEDVSGTSGKIALAPTKENDINFEIVGFVQDGGDHTLYKSSNRPDTTTTLKLDGARVSTVSGDTSKIAYKFTKMNFTNLQSFYALVKVTGTGTHKYSTNEIYTYQKITLVPSKNVFFDDTAEAIHYENSSDTSSGYGVWSRITDGGSDVSNAVDNFGDLETAQQSTENSVKYSFGDAHKVSVSNTLNDNWPSAQFTFTGSGFDLISVTDSDGGVYMVTVYRGSQATGESIKKKLVDTYYGYSYGQLYYKPWRHKIVVGNESGGEVLYVADYEYDEHNLPGEGIIANNFATAFYTMDPDLAKKDENNQPILAYGWVKGETSEVIYQVPCISLDLGSVDTYTVVVEPRFSDAFGHYNENGDVKYYNLILDGVRIYNPADGNNEALAKYAENGETYTSYELIRNSSTLQSNYIVIEGMNNLTESQLNAYLEGAPKNELCIMSGGTAAFDVDFSDLTDARLGLKAANGTPCSVTITGKDGSTPITLTVNSATEQYISLKDLRESSGSTTITVSNSGSGILSLTKLMKASNTESAVTSSALSVGPKTAPRAFAAVRMLKADLTIDEETVETASAEDGTVTITLQTSEDAQTVVVRDADGNVVDPESMDFTIDETGVKNWTIVLADAGSDDPGAPGTYSYTYTLQAEYENGYAPEEPTTVTVTVTIPEPETEEEQTVDFGTSKFGRFFAKLIEFIRFIISLFK